MAWIDSCNVAILSASSSSSIFPETFFRVSGIMPSFANALLRCSFSTKLNDIQLVTIALKNSFLKASSCPGVNPKECNLIGLFESARRCSACCAQSTLKGLQSTPHVKDSHLRSHLPPWLASSCTCVVPSTSMDFQAGMMCGSLCNEV
jgi:hypothetical protein